jgi:hypothetical protein
MAFWRFSQRHPNLVAASCANIRRNEYFCRWEAIHMNEALTPNANYLEPTFKRAAIVWWAFFWRTALIGGLLGFTEGFVGGIAGKSAATMHSLLLISIAILTVPVSIYVVQLVLRKRYGEFTIRLLSAKAEPSN